MMTNRLKTKKRDYERKRRENMITIRMKVKKRDGDSRRNEDMMTIKMKRKKRDCEEELYRKNTMSILGL